MLRRAIQFQTLIPTFLKTYKDLDEKTDPLIDAISELPSEIIIHIIRYTDFVSSEVLDGELQLLDQINYDTRPDDTEPNTNRYWCELQIFLIDFKACTPAAARVLLDNYFSDLAPTSRLFLIRRLDDFSKSMHIKQPQLHPKLLMQAFYQTLLYRHLPNWLNDKNRTKLPADFIQELKVMQELFINSFQELETNVFKIAFLKRLLLKLSNENLLHHFINLIRESPYSKAISHLLEFYPLEDMNVDIIIQQLRERLITELSQESTNSARETLQSLEDKKEVSLQQTMLGQITEITRITGDLEISDDDRNRQLQIILNRIIYCYWLELDIHDPTVIQYLVKNVTDSSLILLSQLFQLGLNVNYRNPDHDMERILTEILFGSRSCKRIIELFRVGAVQLDYLTSTTPLIAAVKSDSIKKTQLALDITSTSLNAKNSRDQNAFVVAIKSTRPNSVAIAKALLDVNPNFLNKTEATLLLMTALRIGSLEKVRLILDGAGQTIDIRYQDHCGKTIYSTALEIDESHNRREIIVLLQARGYFEITPGVNLLAVPEDNLKDLAEEKFEQAQVSLEMIPQKYHIPYHFLLNELESLSYSSPYIKRLIYAIGGLLSKLDQLSSEQINQWINHLQGCIKNVPKDKVSHESKLFLISLLLKLKLQLIQPDHEPKFNPVFHAVADSKYSKKPVTAVSVIINDLCLSKTNSQIITSIEKQIKRIQTEQKKAFKKRDATGFFLLFSRRSDKVPQSTLASEIVFINTLLQLTLEFIQSTYQSAFQPLLTATTQEHSTQAINAVLKLINSIAQPDVTQADFLKTIEKIEQDIESYPDNFKQAFETFRQEINLVDSDSKQDDFLSTPKKLSSC